MKRRNKQLLVENEYVKELLAVLKENPSPSGKDFAEMVAHVGELESRLAEAVEELKTMRQELQQVQNRSLKAVLQKSCKSLEDINALMPSCACKAALSRGKYLIGVLLPFIILGGGSIIFLFVYPGTISILTMAVNIVLAGADVLIAAKVLREKNVLIADHPTEAGYIAFCK